MPRGRMGRAPVSPASRLKPTALLDLNQSRYLSEDGGKLDPQKPDIDGDLSLIHANIDVDFKLWNERSIDMGDRVEIRLSGLSSVDWRETLEKRLADSELRENVNLIEAGTSETESVTAVVDPLTAAALISGGALIIAALIPVLKDIFTEKSPEQSVIVHVVLHGTADSTSAISIEKEISEADIEQYLSQIGSLTEIEISE